jgi:riboflavin biosynthesis pyrimidine reductase
LEAGSLPQQLSELYDGGLDIPQGAVYANFVGSIDGIVAIEQGKAASGGIISGRNPADRFVMGLLRAFADAVLVGAGTVRAEGGRALWTSEFIFPDAAGAFRELRERLGRDVSPRLVIVTSSGDLDPADRALQAGALVLTTRAAAASLQGKLPGATEVRAIADAHIEPKEILDVMRAEGLRTILTEGGPRLFGQLVQVNHVDQLFLTVSPSLVGQQPGRSFGMIMGVDFGRSPKWGRLLSIRRHESHLFLRYALK